MERFLKMKTKMFLSLLLLASVLPSAFATGNEDDTKAPTRKGSVLVAPVDDARVPAQPQRDAAGS